MPLALTRACIVMCHSGEFLPRIPTMLPGKRRVEDAIEHGSRGFCRVDTGWVSQKDFNNNKIFINISNFFLTK